MPDFGNMTPREYIINNIIPLVVHYPQEQILAALATAEDDYIYVDSSGPSEKADFARFAGSIDGPYGGRWWMLWYRYEDGKWYVDSSGTGGEGSPGAEE